MHRITLLLLLLSFNSAIACVTSSDCPNTAKYCNDFQVCEDCCNFDFATCPSDCTPDGVLDQCQNEVGVSCNVLAVPELPSKQRSALVLICALAAALVYLTWSKSVAAKKGNGR